MKSFIGYGLIILSIVSFFRIPNFGQNLAESLGYLTGLSLFAIPGILLVRSAEKDSVKKK